MKPFGKKIEFIMQEMGWTQSQLARKLGISQPSVSQYLKGRLPSAPILQRLSQISGYPVNFFLEEDLSAPMVREKTPPYGSDAGPLARWKRLTPRQQELLLELMDEMLKSGK